MDSFTFTTEDEGILNAEQALNELRTLLGTGDSPSIGGASATSGSPLSPSLRWGDAKYFALRAQLENLEDMLGMITDARLARSMVEDENERAFIGGRGDGENADLLTFIVMTAMDIVYSETYQGFDVAIDSGDEESLSDLGVVGYTPDPTCIICADVVSLTGRLETPCGHFYCPGCALNLVETYTSQLFPAGPLRCCPNPHPPIPSRRVHRFINGTLRTKLEEKITEAETPYDQRVYCPQENCKKFIDPARITPAARSTGSIVCPSNTCGVGICLSCKQLVHPGVNCEKHADDVQATRIQKLFGWGRCPGCGFVVEKISGCSAVSCSRCGRGFTYAPLPQN